MDQITAIALLARTVAGLADDLQIIHDCRMSDTTRILLMELDRMIDELDRIEARATEEQTPC